MTHEQMVALLGLFARADCHDDLLWYVKDDGTLRFSVLCSDVFWWGTADTEYIDIAADIELLRDSFEATDWHWLGGVLYCARKRKMRPQGAFYKGIPEALRPLFDAVGPEREIELGNPKPQP